MLYIQRLACASTKCCSDCIPGWIALQLQRQLLVWSHSRAAATPAAHSSRPSPAATEGCAAAPKCPPGLCCPTTLLKTCQTVQCSLGAGACLCVVSIQTAMLIWQTMHGLQICHAMPRPSSIHLMPSSSEKATTSTGLANKEFTSVALRRRGRESVPEAIASAC